MLESSHSKRKTGAYDVALSFAGEDRAYVEVVARILKEKGIRVFYDKYEEAALWGKNLYTHLSDVYGTQAIYTVAFLSAHYARKVWTSHERQSAQARAFEENREYLLPARFDDTPIPGILNTIGYIDLRSKTPEQLSELVVAKLSTYFADRPLPAHEVVENDGVYWPTSRPDAVLVDVDLNELKVRIAIRPSAYVLLQRLLDDLFIHYLASVVSPYSYGSEWILVGEPFRTRIACPIEWVEHEGKAIIGLSPTWSSNALLADGGLTGGTYWRVSSPKQEGHGRGYYGVLTNSIDVANLLQAEAKAMSLLVHHAQQFSSSSLSKTNKDAFRFQLVFRDWLGIGSGVIYVDNGLEMPSEIRTIFQRE